MVESDVAFFFFWWVLWWIILDCRGARRQRRGLRFFQPKKLQPRAGGQQRQLDIGIVSALLLLGSQSVTTTTAAVAVETPKLEMSTRWSTTCNRRRSVIERGGWATRNTPLVVAGPGVCTNNGHQQHISRITYTFVCVTEGAQQQVKMTDNETGWLTSLDGFIIFCCTLSFKQTPATFVSSGTTKISIIGLAL